MLTSAAVRGRVRAPFALGPVVLIAASVTVVLLVVSGRYGYHRDELYFLAAGHHLAWGYPDQPALVPFLARVLSDLAPGSVAALQIPSALVAGALVVLTGAIAAELDASRPAQVLASASMATAAVLLGAGHLLSTTTYDLLAWTALLWLVVRLLRTEDTRLWLAVGVVAGAGLFASDLVAFLMAAIVVGIAVAGPRRTLRSPWLWLGGAVAIIAWSPYLAWQAGHGWPELTVGRAIAAGSSASSQPRSLFLPYRLGLVSPWLAPIWIGGLVRLFRDPGLRWCRSIGWAYVALVVAFAVTGGKAYYLAGMFPVLLASGAAPTYDWVGRGRRRLRRGLLLAGLGLSALGSVLFTLPILPVATLASTSLVSVNSDLGAPIGWPTVVAEIAAVYRRLPSDQQAATAILTVNYGEAGAIDHFGAALGLPHAYSVHNGYWYWDPPPANATMTVAVGFDAHRLGKFCANAHLATRLR
jgi:4-amino-4-deoxy-L-arabinose transferase-like glycosyltransferase